MSKGYIKFVTTETLPQKAPHLEPTEETVTTHRTITTETIPVSHHDHHHDHHDHHHDHHDHHDHHHEQTKLPKGDSVIKFTTTEPGSGTSRPTVTETTITERVIEK
jgi:hypothetical protein